jgi:hypothetical protein
MDGVWVINTSNAFFSKAGFTGLRNLNMIKID